MQQLVTNLSTLQYFYTHWFHVVLLYSKEEKKMVKDISVSFCE